MLLQKELNLYVDKNGTVLDLLQEAFIDVSTHSLEQLQLLLCYITSLHLSCDVQCTLFRLLMYMFLFFLLS